MNGAVAILLKLSTRFCRTMRPLPSFRIIIKTTRLITVEVMQTWVKAILQLIYHKMLIGTNTRYPIYRMKAIGVKTHSQSHLTETVTRVRLEKGSSQVLI